MKYYVYISEAKLNMLFPQIPRSLWDRISAELSFEVQSVKGLIRMKDKIDNRISKLERVVKYIENNFKVGTVERPEFYFRGSLPLNYTIVPPSLLFFGGKLKKGRLTKYIGLGGSVRHLMGVPEEERPIGSIDSYTPTIVNSIGKKLYEAGVLKERELRASGGYISDDTLDPIDEDDSALFYVSQTINFMNSSDLMHEVSPTQQYEFLAIRLLAGRLTGGDHVILGTPLYIALAS